jgi:hypothetical protein
MRIILVEVRVSGLANCWFIVKDIVRRRRSNVEYCMYFIFSDITKPPLNVSRMESNQVFKWK